MHHKIGKLHHVSKTTLASEDTIFKILSLTDSKGNSQYICYKDFHLTLTMLLHYLVKFKNNHIFLKCYSFAIEISANVL